MTVDVKFTGDNRDLLRKLEQMQRKYDELKGTMRGSNAEGKAGADAMGSSFGAAASQLTGIVTGMVSVGSALALIRSEFTHIVEQQQKSLEFSKGGGLQIPELIRNLPPGTSYTDVSPTLHGIATSSGIPFEEIVSAAAAGFTVAGKAPPEQVMAAIAAGTGLAPEGGEALKGLSTAAIKLGSVPGGTTDSKELLGMVMQGAQGANVTDLREYSQNVSAAALSLTSAGSTQEQSIEFASLLTHLAQDVTGRRTASLAPNLAKQLRELVPEASSPTDAVELLLADPERGKEIFGQMSVEARSFFGVEGLLTGGAGSDAAATYRDLQNKVRSGAAASASFDAKVAEFKTSPELSITEIERRSLETQKEQYAGRPGDAAEAQLLGITSSALAGSGVGYARLKLDEASMRATSLAFGPEKVAEEGTRLLRNRQLGLLGRLGPDSDDSDAYNRALQSANPEARKQVELLEKQIALQQETLDVFKRSTEGQPNAAPAVQAPAGAAE